MSGSECCLEVGNFLAMSGTLVSELEGQRADRAADILRWRD
ncbi:MAG: hypothetical protein ACRDWI_07910 [Jiangellaceae bacterium]